MVCKSVLLLLQRRKDKKKYCLCEVNLISYI